MLNGKVKVGLLIIGGVVVTGIARLAGFGPPSSNTGYGQGSSMGWWIGSVVGLLIGLAAIGNGLSEQAEYERRRGKETLLSKLGAIQFSGPKLFGGLMLFIFLIVVAGRLFGS